jgi:hypothetical protein
VLRLFSSGFISKNIKTEKDRTNILPFVLYGCETWSVPILGEKRRLRMFENRVLRRIFGPKRDDVTGNWRRSYFSTNTPIIRVIKYRIMRWVREVARVVEKRGTYRAFVGRNEEKIPMGRPRRGWESNIKMDHKEGCGTRYGLLWFSIETAGGPL